MAYQLKKEDTLPIISETILDSAGSPVNLSGASVTFKFKDPKGNKTSANATVVSAAAGTVTYTLTQSQTQYHGRAYGEFKVEVGGTHLTYPHNRSIAIDIYKNIDDATVIGEDGEIVRFYNVKQYGAKGDGVTDDTTAINDTIAAAGSGGVVYFPRGTYMISSPITYTARTLMGENLHNSNSSFIKAMATFSGNDPFGDNAMLTTASNPGAILNLVVDGNSVVDYGIHTYAAHGNRNQLNGVIVKNCEVAGFYIDRTQVAHFRRCLADSNNGHGWLITAANSSVYWGCHSTNNTGDGFRINRGENGCTVTFMGCQSEQNTLYGFNFQGTSDANGGRIEHARMYGSLCEGNDSGGILLQYCQSARIVDTRIIPGINGAGDYPIALVGSRSCFIANNRVSWGSHDDNITIRDDSTANRRNFFVDNRRESGTVVDPATLQNLPDEHVRIGTNVQCYATAAPTTGTWEQGDVVWNENAAAAGSVGWVCVSAGTPGTWKTFGTISA